MKKLLGNILLAIVGFICFLIAVLCIWYIIDVLPFFNNSENAIAELNELKDCHEGKCDAKYTYTVDGMSYDVFDSFVTDYYEPTLTVHYNLEDPSDYTLSDTGSPTSNIIMIVFGAVFALVGIIGIKNKNIRVK